MAGPHLTTRAVGFADPYFVGRDVSEATESVVRAIDALDTQPADAVPILTRQLEVSIPCWVF